MNAHRRGGKEDKQVKQHDYVTSSQSDEGLHHHNTSKMFVHITVYCTLVVFRVNRRKETRRGGNGANHMGGMYKLSY